VPFVLANIFQPLIDAFEAVLVFFHDHVGLGWGTSIIALTVVVRAALLPLTIKQFKSMQGMQKIAPQMKELQKRYKDDKQRQQQELMALYKEHSVNPFGSCLPLVAQMPVFLSLFYMLRKDLRHDICPAINPAHVVNPTPCGESDASQFLFIPDITNKATGIVLAVLVILYIGSQLLSSVLMASQIQDKNQRMLMIGMPFVFTLFIFGFPAGLIMYWITTNLWTVGQSYILRKRMGIGIPSVAEAVETITGHEHHEPDADAPAGTSGKAAPAASPAPRRGRKAKAEATDDADAPEPKPKREAAPPPPPRRSKKKRSGRRR
jgi:YidC/Oxa1 family membrane protein insertase